MMFLQQKFMKTAGTENKTTKYNFSNHCAYIYHAISLRNLLFKRCFQEKIRKLQMHRF